jgi:antitoxin component HigA of HigAB toxin-antitoxin module
MIRKNTAGQYLTFGLVSASTGAAVTGATVTAMRAIDASSQAACTGTVSELAGGQYRIALSQADTNGDCIGYLFTASGAVPVHVTVLTSSNLQADVWTYTTRALSAAPSDSSGVTTLLSRITTAPPTAVQIRTEMDSNSTKLANLDINVGSRLATAGYTAPTTPPTAAAIADAVWDEATTGHVTAGTFGEQVKTDIDAILADTDSLDTTKLTSTRAGYLDAAITSRMATFTYTVPPTVAAIRTEMDSNSTKLANLDTNVGSRLATAGYTAPSTPPTAAAIADAVWDEALSGHLSGGSTGASLNGAGAAGDPWTASLPGAYGIGTAGYIVGNNLDAEVSGISGGGGGGLDAAGVRAAIGLSSANLDTQLAALPTATEIRQEIDSNSTKLDTNVGSRLATSGYTAPTTPPTVVAIRQEIDANSTKLDVNVGSRLPTASYSAAPTAAAIRAEIDTNSTKLDEAVSSRLSSAGYTAPPSAASIASAVMGYVTETGWTFVESVRVLLASAAGKLAGAATNTVAIRDVNDTKARITASVDADGNRASVSYDKS